MLNNMKITPVPAGEYVFIDNERRLRFPVVALAMTGLQVHAIALYDDWPELVTKEQGQIVRAPKE